MKNVSTSNNLSERKPSIFRIVLIVFSKVHSAPSHASPFSKGHPPSSLITCFSASTSSLSDVSGEKDIFHFLQLFRESQLMIGKFSEDSFAQLPH